MANGEVFEAFVGKTCLDTTHLADNLETTGDMRNMGNSDGRMVDWGAGEPGTGKRGAVPLSHLLLSLYIGVSRDTIGPDLKTVCLTYCTPCFWSQLSRTWPVSQILHFCSPASQKGHPQ